MTETSCSESSPEVKPAEKQLIYRCKKCRRIVASEENIVQHEQGKGWIKWGAESNPAPECTAIFVEPMKWMQQVQDGYVWEKLYCMGCKARPGSFNWAGMQCSCGAWVNPAFQLVKSKIDECQF
ncbi:probable inactive dual specificity protein phosphatase-like At4g18593 [Amaranthus tricolor]|uniref:probable inactive dual specificity protein phosphatase-like At4g18593 n=1 Tax=Amaranthus tricolor TaxID=29722 RepID=UPI002584BABC|nr:probable inactive dual specificity protein phosphatase-like At4g18593 [Amaranthus tricolor]